MALFVNHDADGALIYHEWFSIRGYQVLNANTAEEALELAVHAQPDVIVTELRERTEKGWKTPELLKADYRTCHIPVVAVTSQVFDEDRARAVWAGCELFLPKPITPTELELEISRFLS